MDSKKLARGLGLTSKRFNDFTLEEVFSPHFVGCRNAAFTLAEVLITLGIIGVVAAMTLPTLITKYQEKATVTKLKKMYSVLSQAYNMYLKDNEPQWFDQKTEEGANGAFEVFKPYLNLSKDCGLNDYSCIYQGKYLYKNGNFHSGYGPEVESKYYKVMLADGASIWFRGGATVEDPSGNGLNTVIFYDVNGPKPPNKWGEDLFEFLVRGRNLYPGGQLKFISNPETYDNGCLKSDATGYDCASWVIFKENMDYLHCSDLSWNGKSTCK